MSNDYPYILSMNSDDRYTKFFRIVESGPLDGLDVKIRDISILDSAGNPLAEVLILRNNNTLIGDRPAQQVLPKNTMYVSARNLTLSPFQEEMEFSSKSNFGKYLYEINCSKDACQVVSSRYENALSVTIFDLSVQPAKTLFSRVFFDSISIDRAVEDIKDFVATNEPEVLVIKLKGLK